jgi:hypothetical protein
MKNLAGMSVLALGVLIFLLLALAVYVFRTWPYVLALVLLGEVVVLAAAILAPLLSGGAKKGWFGRALFSLIAAALANSYMLFLANRWGVQPQGWYHTILHWQDGAVGLVLGAVRFVANFLDAVLRAVFSLHEDPINGFLDKLRPPSTLDAGEPIPGAGRLPGVSLTMVANMLLGIIASLWTASVVKGVLPRGHAHDGGHGKSAAH